MPLWLPYWRDKYVYSASATTNLERRVLSVCGACRRVYCGQALDQNKSAGFSLQFAKDFLPNVDGVSSNVFCGAWRYVMYASSWLRCCDCYYCTVRVCFTLSSALACAQKWTSHVLKLIAVVPEDLGLYCCCPIRACDWWGACRERDALNSTGIIWRHLP